MFFIQIILGFNLLPWQLIKIFDTQKLFTQVSNSVFDYLYTINDYQCHGNHDGIWLCLDIITFLRH